jgi:hypothetical protein
VPGQSLRQRRRCFLSASCAIACVACGARTSLLLGLGESGSAGQSALADAGVGGAARGSAGAVGGERDSDAGSGGAAARDAGADAAPDSGHACKDACVEGQTSCVMGGIATCEPGGMGCFVWSSPAPCACQLVAGNAVCQPIPAPRPIAPLSTATVSSHQPLFHWALAADDDGATVEVCRDRACAQLVTSFSSSGNSGAPGASLSAGLYYWRLRGNVGQIIGAQTSAVWEFSVGVRSALINTSWGTVPDLNGDGFADVVNGTPQVNDFNGAVQVHLGDSTRLSEIPTSIQ